MVQELVSGAGLILEAVSFNSEDKKTKKRHMDVKLHVIFMFI